MKSAEQSSDWPCPFEAEIPAYLQDELSAASDWPMRHTRRPVLPAQTI